MAECTMNDFAVNGAKHFEDALKPCMEELEAALLHVSTDEPGVRIHGLKALELLLNSKGCIGTIAASVLGSSARPVRAVLFNKSTETNWSLTWHQDRTICVKDRREIPGFEVWTLKSGMHHVEPPFELLSRMVTLRAHLDDVLATNAPLLVAPGSHAIGKILVTEINDVVRNCGTMACLAKAGDVWLYATPILHASEAASEPSSRRVLQVDFAAEPLPDGLEWLGI